MALVVANVGELLLLDALLKDSSGENFYLKLYKTNVTPDQDSVDSDFTEADFSGYSAKTLTRSSWDAASTVSNKASSSYVAQTWTNSGSSQTIYGYYIVGVSTGTLYWAELFASPRVLATGESETLTPVFTLNSES